MTEVVKMDRVRFFRDVKFELYEILKDYDFQKGLIGIERKFFFFTYKDETNASLHYVPFPIDDVHIKYSHKPQRIDLTNLAKYVGMEVLKKCEKMGRDNVVVHDYSNFTNHDQLYSEDVKAGFVKFLL